jgi:UDP-N-acetylmuramoyl-tripeptide--D-alanyl-D-alanine ligase
MKPVRLADLAGHLGQEALDDPGVVVTGVTTDSRNVRAGDLFVAISGESFNGNAYARAAVEAGAVAVVTSDAGNTGIPRILVDDTLLTLRDLAALYRADLLMPVIAITGSTGKTSTKDLLAAALPGSWVSPRSFNNEIGVPLTVLGTPENASFLVAEVGSRGKGHIEFLMPAVRPNVSVVTNLGVVHLETFGTTDELANAKFELVEALDQSGIAVLPAGEKRLHRPHPGATMLFGTEPWSDVRVSNIQLDRDGYPEFDLESPAGSTRLRLRVAGAHQTLNAAAAVAAGIAVDVGFETMVEGLQQAEGSAWRMEIHRGRYTVVNDAYNANPDSMEAAMTTVAGMPGRHIAVLGTMAELGHLEATEHERIGRLAADLGFVAVITVGDEPGIATAAGPIGRNVPDADTAMRIIAGLAGDGDVVLVKASRAIGLEALALRLAEEAQK